MIKTRLTEKLPMSILNEFFSVESGNIVKGVSFPVFKKKLLSVLQRIIENEGINYTSDEKGLRTHMFTCVLLKILQKVYLPDNLNICWNFKRYMKCKRFRKLYLCALNLLFCLDIYEISAMIGIKCCTGRNHFSFCRMKWEELFRFCQKGMLKVLRVKRKMSLRVLLQKIEPEPELLLAN